MAVGIGESGSQMITRQVPVPVPAKGEVLIRMSAAPINPSDINRIKHIDQHEKKEFIAGIEGSGTVIGHGKGLIPNLWMGKRVACSASNSFSGTWAEYLVTSAMACVPLPSGIPDEQGAMMLVNPMTAVAFIRMARAGGHKAIINTAAGSALGRMLEVLAGNHGISIIQVVRSEIQKVKLHSQGAQYVLNSTQNGFDEELKTLAAKTNATLVFDAVGGEMTRRLLLAVPFGSIVVVYGNLSGEQPLIDHRSLVTDNKKVTGFYLVNWHRENGITGTLKCILEARNMLKKQITIPVQAKFSLSEVQLAVETYYGNMSKGKVLLIP